eukprot:XP_001702218.1 predicted protein [Chlamydomonas reinhardtii]
MSGAFAARTALEESDKGRVDRTRVKRYWPGKAPEWAEQQEEAEAAAAPRDRVRTEVAAPVIVRRRSRPSTRQTTRMTDRATVAERAALEEEEEAVVEKDRARKAARKVEDELYAATKDNIVRRKEQALAAAQVFAKPRKFKR